MDMSRSSLLGRLEAFLPEMEKANRETDKLAQEEKLEVIDKKLKVASPEDLREQVDGTDPEDDEEYAKKRGGGVESELETCLRPHCFSPPSE